MAISDNRLLASLRDVSIETNGRALISHVGLDVHAGEIITLIGPNGAGKTTLLRALLGLQAVTSGTVHRARGLRVGYMPQRLQIDPIIPLSVQRFLTLSRRTSQQDVQRSLKEVGAAHVQEQSLHVISGGELQRVLLARALMCQPDLLILDEPAQGVDVVGQSDLYTLIGSIRDRYGCGVLMVSHDLHLVMEAADSVICLNQHVCCTGHPEAVSQHPEYLKLFGDAPLKGLAVYTHAHDHEHNLHGDVVPLAESEEKEQHEGHDHE